MSTATAPEPTAPAVGPIDFTDAAGRTWPFRRITLADLDDLLAVGLDVEKVSENLDLLFDLIVRRRTFAAVLYWFIGPAVERAGVTPRQLHESLDGDALARAVESITRAIVDFFPFPPSEKRRLLADLTAGAGGSGFAPPSSPALPASTPGA